MEMRDVVFSLVMVLSSFVLTYEWVGRFTDSQADSLIVLSAVVMVGALAAMILSIDMRLRKMNDEINAKERSLRINIQSIEGSVDRKMNEVAAKVDGAMDTFTRRMYR